MHRAGPRRAALSARSSIRSKRRENSEFGSQTKRGFAQIPLQLLNDTRIALYLYRRSKVSLSREQLSVKKRNEP